MRKTCSICSSPPSVQHAVNEQLAKKVRMIDVAMASGFSKSAVGRHAKACLQRVHLAEYRSMRQCSRYAVMWPDGSINNEYGRKLSVIPEGWLPIEVSYERPPSPASAPNKAPLLEAAMAEAIAEDLERFPKSETPS